MAGIYRGPQGGLTPGDIGPIDADGHDDHDHRVIAISGDQLPDEVKEALVKALSSGMGLPDGVQITEKPPEDPHPLTTDEWRELRITLTGVAYMLLQGVQEIEMGLDPDSGHRTMTREEAVSGLKRASENLMERFGVLVRDAHPEPEEGSESDDALAELLRALKEDQPSEE